MKKDTKKVFKEVSHKNNLSWKTNIFIFSDESTIDSLLASYYEMNNYEDFFIILPFSLKKSVWETYSKIAVILDNIETGNGIYSKIKDFKYGPMFKELYVLKDSIIIWYRKNVIDRTKLPCPVCFEFNVKSNSWTNVGLASWECHNEQCERSESNRGKRFNFYSLVQDQIRIPLDKEDEISQKIKLFSRDLSKNARYKDFIRYIKDVQSYDGKVSQTIVGSEENGFYDKVDSILSDEWIENALNIEKSSVNFNSVVIEKNKKRATLFNGDCNSIVNVASNKKVDLVITSPPYYNAREYSTWPNMIDYFRDMLRICNSLKSVLSSDGKIVWNIGDISGNSNMITNSLMDQKRLQLGAYTIWFFNKIGMSLLENVLWDKIEPQSKKKFTNIVERKTHRPINVYEHNLVFQKDANSFNNQLQVIEIFPVKKINSKGENIFGHTAPFPEELPAYFISKYNKKIKVVCDPFLGSGTSGIVALKNKKDFIGFELSADYFELAKKRIENAI